MKKMGKITTRKLVTYTGIIAVVAASSIALAYTIKYAKEDHRYSEYFGQIVNAITNINKNVTTKKYDVKNIIESVYLEDGRGSKINLKLDKIFDAQVKGDKAAETAAYEEIDAYYEKLMKETKTNYNLVLKTKIIKFENNYFDIFGIKDSLDFIDYILNDVAWGTDIFTLSDFKLVRGVPKDGGVITLGGHGGTREKTFIQFWPDAFFGVMPVLNNGGEGVLTTTNNIVIDGLLGVGSNKDLLNRFATATVNGKKGIRQDIYDNFDDFVSEDYFTNEFKRNTLQRFFTAEVWEDCVKVYGDALMNKMSQDKWFEGTDAMKATSQLPGYFPSLYSFNNYVKGKKDLPWKDELKLDDGSVITVYPWDYMRRILLALYFPIQVAWPDIPNPDKPDEMMKDPRAEFSIAKRDELRRKSPSTTYVSDRPDIYTKKMVYNGDYDSQDPMFPGNNFRVPYLTNNFAGWERVVSEKSVDRIIKVMFDATGIKPYDVISSSELDYNGNPKRTVLYEKYMDILPTFAKMKDKKGWSPIDVVNGKVSGDQYVPLLYLWTEMERTTSFKDTKYATDGSLTPAEVAHLDSLTNKKVEKNKIGIEWLKYVTTHEYGHHKTLHWAKDLSDTTSRPDGLNTTTGDMDTPGQVYANASWNTNYESVWSKNFINNYLMARTGVGGNVFVDDATSREISYLLADLTVQYSAHSKKTAPYFQILGSNTPVIGEKDGKPIINEQAATDFIDFAESWRGFKTLQQIMENITTAWISEGGEEIKVDGNMPTNIALIAVMLNSMDRNSFSISPALPVPHTGFARPSAQDAIDGIMNYENLDPKNPNNPIDQIALERWIRGWHDYTNGSLAISNDTSTFSFTNQKYRRQVRDDAGNLITTGGPNNDGFIDLRIPRAFADVYNKNTFDWNSNLEQYVNNGSVVNNKWADLKTYPENDENGDGDITSDEIAHAMSRAIVDNRILSPFYGGNAYVSNIVPFSEADIASADAFIGSDARNARTWYVTMYYNPSAPVDQRYTSVPKTGYTQKTLPITSGEIIVSNQGFDFAPVLTAIMNGYQQQKDENGVAKNWIEIAEVGGVTFTSEYEYERDVNGNVVSSNGRPVLKTITDTDGNLVNVKVTAETEDATLDNFNLKLLRLTREKEYSGAENDETYAKEWASKTLNSVNEFMLETIAFELNKDVDKTVPSKSVGRFVIEDSPLRQGAMGEEDLRNNLNQMFGSRTYTTMQNANMGASISTDLFQTYYQNFGRFFEIMPTDVIYDPTNPLVGAGYYPTSATLLSYLYSSVPNLNWIYTTYLAQGAFPYYQQITVDYQTSLAEMLARDWSQLTYSPSTKSLQQWDKTNYNELNEMVMYSMFPIYTHVYTHNGAVVNIPQTGGYNPVTHEMLPASKTSGFYEDLALRRETDSSLYNLTNTSFLTDIEGNNITDEDGKRIKGHDLNNQGKALVNFFRETSGISSSNDINTFYLDEKTGFGKMAGYISVADSKKFDYIGFKDVRTGKEQYIPIAYGYGNEFFNTQLGVNPSRLSMLDHYYDLRGVVGSSEYDPAWVVPQGVKYNDKTGLVQIIDENEIQIGWSSADFLMTGFANSIFKNNNSYEVRFTQGKTFETTKSRPVNLGYMPRTTRASLGADNVADTTDDIYEVVQDDWRNEFVVNKFDTFTGTLFFNQDSKNGKTILRITKRV